MKIGDEAQFRGHSGFPYEIVGITEGGQAILSRTQNGLLIGDHWIADENQLEIRGRGKDDHA